MSLLGSALFTIIHILALLTNSLVFDHYKLIKSSIVNDVITTTFQLHCNPVIPKSNIRINIYLKLIFVLK